MHSLKSYISYKPFNTAAAWDRLSWRPHDTDTANDDRMVSSATQNTSLDMNNWEEAVKWLKKASPHLTKYVGGGNKNQKQTFLCGSKIQDDELCWVQVALWGAGPRIWRGLGRRQRQPKFIQALCALISLNLLLDRLLVWLLPRRVTATPLHANLQAPTQNLVNGSECQTCIHAQLCVWWLLKEPFDFSDYPDKYCPAASTTMTRSVPLWHITS